jgi:hypothetical protein
MEELMERYTYTEGQGTARQALTVGFPKLMSGDVDLRRRPLTDTIFLPLLRPDIPSRHASGVMSVGRAFGRRFRGNKTSSRIRHLNNAGSPHPYC